MLYYVHFFFLLGHMDYFVQILSEKKFKWWTFSILYIETS